MFLLHVDNKVFSQITEKITDKSRITGNWVFTVHRKKKSKITDHRNTPSPPPTYIRGRTRNSGKGGDTIKQAMLDGVEWGGGCSRGNVLLPW